LALKRTVHFTALHQKKKETPLVAETKEQTTVETVKEEEEEEAPVVEKEAEGETTFSYSREDGE
jgi:hypothetical protein